MQFAEYSQHIRQIFAQRQLFRKGVSTPKLWIEPGPPRYKTNALSTEPKSEIFDKKCFLHFPGAKAKNGAPILTFPDRPNHPEPTEDEYRKVVTYLCSVPP